VIKYNRANTVIIKNGPTPNEKAETNKNNKTTKSKNNIKQTIKQTLELSDWQTPGMLE
jgi:hypothetical protein